MVKKILCLLLLLPMHSQSDIAHTVEPFTLEVRAHTHARMNILIGVLKPTPELMNVAEVIKKDFENEVFGLNEQYAVTVVPLEKLSSLQEMRNIFAQGYHVVLFLNAENQSSISWRLYTHDKNNSAAQEEAVMLEGKKYTKRGSIPRGWGHNIADAVRFDLTGYPGFFSTKLAYCKDIRTGHKIYKYIYIADYDGTHEELIVDVPTINVAPRWNKDNNNPLLFYSEATNSNMRLMAINLRKQRRVASNFDGLNMLPAFSHDGKKVVFCASRGQGNCELYYYEKGTFKQITKNGGNNVSPSLVDDGTQIYFCSDFKTGSPQIYHYNLLSKEMTPITEKGFCTAPCYSDTNGLLAYTKNILGSMQIFVYNTATKQHKQLTFDNSHKDECSWSPCGNYLLYSVEKGNSRSLALWNMNTGKQKILRSGKDVFSYPAWSPRYEQYPTLVT